MILISADEVTTLIWEICACTESQETHGRKVGTKKEKILMSPIQTVIVMHIVKRRMNMEELKVERDSR